MSGWALIWVGAIMGAVGAVMMNQGWNKLSRESEILTLSVPAKIQIKIFTDHLELKNDGTHEIVDITMKQIVYVVENGTHKIKERITTGGQRIIKSNLLPGETIRLQPSDIVFGDFQTVPHSVTSVYRSVVFEYFRKMDNKRYINIEPFTAFKLTNEWTLFPVFSQRETASTGDPSTLITLLEEINRIEKSLFRYEP